jgi:predicted SAM-dependent methyltransferase
MWNLNKIKNKEGKIYFNIGSSSYVLVDFVNLDNAVQLKYLSFYPIIKQFLNKQQRQKFENYRLAKDTACLIRFNCSKKIPVPNNSVDHILCSHFLEHLYQEDAKKVLNDYHRILLEKGTLHIILPSLKGRINKYIHENQIGFSADEFMVSLQVSTKIKPNFRTRLREFYGSFGHLHKWMYDEDTIKSLLISSGFKILKNIECPSSFWRIEDKEEINILAVKQFLHEKE